MNKYLKNWTIVRIIRLLIGASLSIAAYFSGHYLFVGLGVWFMIQAFFNVSCCGTAGCDSETPSNSSDTVFKNEIKEYKK